MKRPPDLMDLVNEFADATIRDTEEILQGVVRTDNRQAKRRIAAFRKLRKMGNPGRDALATLLTHISPDVRGMAAAYLLRYRNAEATPVLKKLARGEGLVAFGAQETLKRWEEGTWELDPPDDDK